MNFNTSTKTVTPLKKKEMRADIHCLRIEAITVEAELARVSDTAAFTEWDDCSSDFLFNELDAIDESIRDVVLDRQWALLVNSGRYVTAGGG